MTNKRTHYASKQVGISECGANSFHSLHGLQSIGINTEFNLEQVFEIGQLAIYENIETIPGVTVTMEKVLDGYPLIYHLATSGAASATLSGRSNIRSSVGLSIYSDEQESASGTPLYQCTISGVYPSNLSYSFQVQGNSTESVSLVGNNKVWDNVFTAAAFNNDDAPTAAEGVNRREDIVFGEQAGDVCLLPTDIPGITGSGTNPYNTTTQLYGAIVQSIRTSCNLGREQLFNLGKKGPYHRYVTFPIEVRTDIEVLATAGDNITAIEEADNLTNETIYITTQDGTTIDLGSVNKQASATYGGGNAGQGGANDTVTYSYITYNDFTVTHPLDPTVALRPA